MKCPHCHKEIHADIIDLRVGTDSDGFWHIEKITCPACERFVLHLILSASYVVNGHPIKGSEISRYLVRPRGSMRPSPPKEVPEEFRSDYREAAAVLVDSPKASAALSRRCLQHLIREKAGIKKSDLAKEIDALISSNTLPSHLVEAVDAIRNIGNFAAHPIKATSSGEVLPVEPGEAEWTLDVLDGLFDFYFVQPARLKAKRDALNEKLALANKPPMK
ncbi:DUF4145 domain-containing protein [Methylomonas koyamae]|uniref:DUF4145 domain-containing protein n=1 Tax=Methylomonas koyamae TaxID=702114 RepID=UPI000A8BCB10|nr:DUF4145 domain-containing protein [Methylomonas koyamae]BBL58636.1 hypothetical protein MKFW12EY_22490 [Methylomonas koyamae]